MPSKSSFTLSKLTHKSGFSSSQLGIEFKHSMLSHAASVAVLKPSQALTFAFYSLPIGNSEKKNLLQNRRQTGVSARNATINFKMRPEKDLFDILQAVTVDCKDNGECFTVTDRVAVVERLLENTDYKPVARKPLALLYAKREVCEGDRVLLISSHIDCVYSRCLCNDEGDCLRGTFDNSFTNAAVLWAMINAALPDNVVVAFTGNEESDSKGAVQAVVALGQMGCTVQAALVLDVTNEGWDSGASFTLENDLGIDILTGYNIISSLESFSGKFAFKHNSLPDESWDYAEYGIPSLTLCVPVGGDLHSDAGVLLRKESATEYCNVLSLLAGRLC